MKATEGFLIASLAVLVVASAGEANAQTLVDRTSESQIAWSAQGDNAAYGESIDELFDDDPSTKWLDFAPITWVQVDFGATAAGAYTITDYTITSANDHRPRDPTNWTLSGSMTGQSGSWTVIDTRSQESFLTRFDARSFTVSNPGRYRFYRLHIENLASTNNQWAATQVAEFELLSNGSASPPPPPPPPQNPPPSPPPTTDVSAGATVSVQGELAWAGEVGTNVVDDDPNTKWLDTANTTWIELDLGAAYAVDTYTLTSANDEPGRDPHDWTVTGSTDGSTWTTLDTRSQERFASRFETRTFTFTNETAYRWIRFDIANRASSTGASNATQLAELELFAASTTPACGDGQVNGNETCDGGAVACTTTSGYAGTQACNPSCDGYATCSTTLYCGDGICSAGAEDNASCAADCAAPPPSGNTPTYSGGICPTLVNGMNTNFYVANADTTLPVAPGHDVRYRDFEVRLPPNPNGAPVIFTWHWYGGTSDQAIDWTGLGTVGYDENVILVSPVSVAPAPANDQGYFEWYTGADPVQNPDLELAEDVLACLYDQFNVDLDRIYATGHSAGAMWLSYALQHWSHRLAAALPMSGGEQYIAGYRPPADQSRPPYVTPSVNLPVLALHGGPGDVYYSGFNTDFDFMQATGMLANDLDADGSSVVLCDGGFGHQVPPPQNGVTVAEFMIWPYFLDHPRTGTPYSSNADFPASFPGGWCSMQ